MLRNSRNSVPYAMAGKRTSRSEPAADRC